MATPFPRSHRALRADLRRRPLVGLTVGALTLLVWALWFVLARVAVQEVTPEARLEAAGAAFALDARVTAPVAEVLVEVGDAVSEGDVLIRLDDEVTRLRLQGARARHDALAAQAEAYATLAEAEGEAHGASERAGAADRSSARARAESARIAAEHARENAEVQEQLQAQGHLSETEARTARAEAQALLADAEAARHDLSRLDWDRRLDERDRAVRREEARTRLAAVRGELEVAAVEVARLEEELASRQVRAPADGRVAEVAPVRQGRVVQEGARLATVVPGGEVIAVGWFEPRDALGRIAPGQPALMRLEGFPWTRYGTVALTVDSVAGEVRDGRVRVELTVDDPEATQIPLAHGLPGSIEVEVERISPLGLVLRLAGERAHRMTARWLVPEVVQTSAMDCGPACLKAVLDGHGRPASYGRLREACQTDVDGTSIDTLEDVANQLGVEAAQIMVPSDFALLPEAGTLPAILVVLGPGGLTHFVVVWKRVGPFLQIMDPAVGRQWVRASAFRERVYEHRHVVGATDFEEYARSDDFEGPLRRRLADLGLDAAAARVMIEQAQARPGWEGLAALDAATRLVHSLLEAGAVHRRSVQALLRELVAVAVDEAHEEEGIVPGGYWSVRPAGEDEDGPLLELRGAVLVQLEGVGTPDSDLPAPLSEDLVRAIRTSEPTPLRHLVTMLRRDGLLSPAFVTAALVLAAGTTLVEALLLRGLLEVGSELATPLQRLSLVGATAALLVAATVVDTGIGLGTRQLGRRLETRLRTAFLTKLPRLPDRFLASRLSSDMAERSHTLHAIRTMPMLGAQFLRQTAALGFTVLGIAVLDPWVAPVALVAAVLGVAFPLVVQRALSERDLRVRTHAGALARFYLDALVGLIPVRTHGAEPAVRTAHESLLSEWARAGLRLQRLVVGVEGLQALVGLVLAASVLLAHVALGGGTAAALLLVYWALQIPVHAEGVAIAARQYPARRSVLHRALEPLGAPEEVVAEPEASDGPLALDLRNVGVRAGGHVLLQGVDLAVSAGEHLAVVGSSGAGKSTLVGTILGWHRPAAGQILVDGTPLTPETQGTLRRRTAWVDPSVRLWNRTLLHNLAYGNDATALGPTLETAEVLHVLDRMPDGLQTVLGEGGSRLSGGEGQRVRFGRALLQQDVGLVLLDEAFRGQDREARRRLLRRARERWAGATLLSVTHDVGDARVFPRVVVLEGGRVVEDGAPDELLATEGSRYRALVEAEGRVRRGLWEGAEWRHLRMESGRLEGSS